MLAPAEVTSAPQAVARQFFRQLRRFLNLQYSFRQRIGRETGKINSRISADFAMHWQIRRHYRQAARHRLDQRMRKRFRICWGHINVTGLIEVMKRAIRNRSELYDISSKIVCEQRRRLGSICPRIVARIQSAAKKQFHLLALQTTGQDGHCPKQCFEIAVVIVMAYKKEAESVFPLLELGLRRRWQRRCVARKSIWVKSMVHRKYLSATPLAKFLGKRFTRGNGNVGASYGSPCQPALDDSIRPYRVISAGTNIAEKISGGIKRVTRQKYLRDGRVPKRKVARGNQHLRAAAPDQFRQRRLLTNDTTEHSGGFCGFDKGNVWKLSKFPANRRIQQDRSFRIHSPRQMGNHVAQVGKASTRTRGKAIDKQSDHRLGTTAPKLAGDGRGARETTANGTTTATGIRSASRNTNTQKYTLR